MRMYDLINKKKNKKILSDKEIEFIVEVIVLDLYRLSGVSFTNGYLPK